MILAYDAAGKVFAQSAVKMSLTIMTVFRNDKLMTFVDRLRNDPAPKQGIKEPFINIYSSDLKHVGSVDKYRNVAPIIYTRNGRPAFLQAGSLFDNGKTVLAYEALDDTVYYYNDDGTLSPAYILDLGRRSPPTEAFGADATVPWSRNFHTIMDIYESDRFVFVWAPNHDYGDYFTNNLSIFVFDRHNPGAGGFSAVKPNGKYGLLLDGIAFAPKYTRDNKLVGFMHALEIVDNAARITNPKLKALAATLKEDSNPVIVIVELKK
jgi:hypothetical protein